MTAAAICMRCGVFACVYPPLFFPHDTTTTSMPPTTTNHDCEGWGELDGDFGECGGLEEQNKVCEARATVSLSVSPPPLVHRSVRCRDCRLRLHASARNHHTGVRFDREARYRRERLLFGTPS
ncbi:hypothetical protein B0H14DRAFT_3128138 [Mycena olivaceomarginata]|nr:hypothetical protein B0H14DRAFT_3128138 [Mycena olivaceomarginata]